MPARPLKMATELEISLHPQPEILESFTSRALLHESTTLEDLSSIVLNTSEENKQLATTRYEGLVQLFYHDLIVDVHQLMTETKCEWNPHVRKKLAEKRHIDFRYKVERLRWPDMDRDARRDVLRRVVNCLLEEIRRRAFRDDETKECLELALNLKNFLDDQGERRIIM